MSLYVSPGCVLSGVLPGGQGAMWLLRCPCLQDTAPGQRCAHRGVVGQPTALPGLSGEKPCGGQLADGPGQSAVHTRDLPRHRGAHVCDSGPCRRHCRLSFEARLGLPCALIWCTDWLVFSSFLLYIYSNKIMQQYHAFPLGTATWARGWTAEWVAATPAPDSLRPCGPACKAVVTVQVGSEPG